MMRYTRLGTAQSVEPVARITIFQAVLLVEECIRMPHSIVSVYKVTIEAEPPK